MFIDDSIIYLGVNDHHVDLFEGQYPVPDGMAYNSYLIKSDKIAVLDTVEKSFGDEWLGNLEKALSGDKPSYLVVHHMEPDHSANILRFMERYPEALLVSGKASFPMMKAFFGCEFEDRRIIVSEGDVLDLGDGRALRFVAAPMVHWPEVMMSYELKSGSFFSADAFGKFGALDVQQDWSDEARRYYIGIVGKYGNQVQALLKKAAALDIKRICPLHGPVLEGELAPYLALYDAWSSYRPESQGVTLAYTSVYGNTRFAALAVADELAARGVPCAVFDLARCDIFAAVASAFRYDKLILATTTYNGGIFPFMKHFIEHLTERNFRARRIAIIENGSWAPSPARVIKGLFESSKEIDFVDKPLSLKSAMSSEQRGSAVSQLVDELLS